MFSNGPNSPSSRALIALPPPRSHSPPSPPRIPRSRSTLSSLSLVSPQLDAPWQPILHVSNQVVLYNPRSHALSIAPTSANATPAVVSRRHQRAAIAGADSVIGEPCPYCKQALPKSLHRYPRSESASGDEDREGMWEDVVDHNTDGDDGEFESLSTDPAYHSRASDYFRLLAIANETSSAASGSRRPSLSPDYRLGQGVEDIDERRSRRRSRSRQGRTLSSEGRTHDENRSTKGAFPAEKMAEGYFKTFFQEELKLGMGANGSVFLCQHVLDGNPLGHFAVKKIAVGESHSYLLKILREVRLLERLHHPNIITYHHAWLETSQFSSFGPKVPTLHVLMQWAEGGSLDDFIDVRLGRKPAHVHIHPLMTSSFVDAFTSEPASPASSSQGDLPTEDTEPDTYAQDPSTPRPISTTPWSSPANKGKGKQTHSQNPPQHAQSKTADDQHSRSARIRAFRAYQRAPAEEKERIRMDMDGMLGGPTLGLGVPASVEMGVGISTGAASGALPGIRKRRGEWTAVHLLSAEEVKSLFQDVVEGLGFLHSKSILHLDLKPGNVLLTWDEGQLIPRAMLSDFGTSRDMVNTSKLQRSGNTGTLEYTAPESLPSPQTGFLQQIDSKADIWSMGMILHKLLFFKLPYRYAAEGDANGEPISRDDEGEKMDRLEQEVLSYPGFKSTSNLIASFEARRLPRAFLVLLENLLHKSPAGRPSCERVATAIREGKLDPLGENVKANLPLARPRTGSASGTGEVSPPAGREMIQEKHLLALPSPVEVLGPEEGSWGAWFGTMKGMLGISDVRRKQKKQKRVRLRTAEDGGHVVGGRGMRLLRSSLLVVKVLTIPRLCTDSATRPRPAVAVLLLALALADTVMDHEVVELRRGSSRSDHEREHIGKSRFLYAFRSVQTWLWRVGSGLWVTVGLAMLHFGVLWLSDGFGRKTCCIPLGIGHGRG